MALRATRVGTRKAKEAAQRYLEKGRHDLPCKRCGELVYDLYPDVTAVTCDYCIQFLVEPPEILVKLKAASEKEVKSKGWHFKKHYVSPSGKIYSYGKEVITDDRPVDNTKGNVDGVSADNRTAKKPARKKKSVTSSKKVKKVKRSKK